MVQFNISAAGEEGMMIIANVINEGNPDDNHFWLLGIQQKARGEFGKRYKFLLDALSPENQRALYQGQPNAILTDKTLLTAINLMMKLCREDKIRSSELKESIAAIIASTHRLQTTLDRNAIENTETEALDNRDYQTSSVEAIEASINRGKGSQPKKKVTTKRKGSNKDDDGDDDDDDEFTRNRRLKSTGGNQMYEMANMIGNSINKMGSFMHHQVLMPQSSSSSSEPAIPFSMVSTGSSNLPFLSPISQRPSHGRDNDKAAMLQRTMDKIQNEFQITSIGALLVYLGIPIDALVVGGYLDSDVNDVSGDSLKSFVSYLFDLHREGSNSMRTALINELKLNIRNASALVGFLERSAPSPVSL